MYDWDFNAIQSYIWPLMRGMITTLWISGVSVIFGSALGILLVASRKSSIKLLRYPVVIFIEIFLAMPVLVLLIWAYYCLPLILHIKFSAITTAIIVFSCSLSAFVAETMRSGFEAIPRGQIEAALSLKLSRVQTYLYIVLPQAFRLMLPALLTQYLTCFKLSTLASVIAVYEIMHTADNVVSRTYRPLEVYTIVALIFVLVVLPINLLIRKLESQWGRKSG
jgi:polar amino acid transport system permease protein